MGVIGVHWSRGINHPLLGLNQVSQDAVFFADENAMCGRAYRTYTDEELMLRYRSRRPAAPMASLPVYNLCPTHDTPVLRIVAGEREFESMRWQLVPATEPAFTTKLSTINARSETVFRSPLYRHLIARQRCIVPLSGFFEWKKEGARKRPFRIQLRDEPIMSVAGIWDTWHPGAPDERRSFSVLTTAANNVVQDLHDRMPVVIGREEEDLWLDPEVHDPDILRPLLKPCPDSWLSIIEVSPLVNSPANDTPAVLEPAGLPPGGDSQGRLFE